MIFLILSSPFICIELLLRKTCKHLISCEDYTCDSKYFKCPDFYCILWKFVCNGVWECPGGTDELKMDCSKGTCPGMFHCRNSSICISTKSVCDNDNDCPSKDDKQFCNDNKLYCPTNCSCLFYSLSCIKITQNIQEKLRPYVSIRLDNVTISSGSYLFRKLDNPVILILNYCKLKSICIQAKLSVYLRSLSVPYNLLQKLQKDCLKYARNLYFLNVSKNQVESIQSHAFNSSQYIQVLDFSSNLLTDLHDNSFSGLLQLQILNISRNDIFSVSASVFLNTNITKILTESFVICCSVHSVTHTNCPIKPLWPRSCESLLSDSVVGVFVWLISTFGIAMNISSFFVIWQHILEGAHNYKILVTLLAVSDIMCCISLLIIITANAVFTDNYLQYEFSWRSNIFCYISSNLYLIANFLSVFTINLLALTRYQIAVHPLDSKFLEKKFLSGICVLETIAIFILGIFLNVYFVFTTDNHKYPTGLCLILGHGKHFIVSKITTILTILIQSMSCLSIPILYWLLLKKVSKSKENIKDSFAHQAEGNMSKSVLVSTTNLLIWIPSTILLRLTLSWDDYPYVILIWTSMVIIPLNTLVNPFVFVYFKLIRILLKKYK